jgi:chorismate dehydratase
MNKSLRVGIISFANALPFFENLSQLVANTAELLLPSGEPAVEFFYSTPRTINSKLAQGELDTALISAASYLEHRSNYILLSDFGIASNGPVHSVKLFYKKSISSLILVPQYSESSVALLKVLLKNVWKMDATFEATMLTPEQLLQGSHSFLAIGDACLQLVSKAKWSSYDLGALWSDWTSLPFVYALFATHSDSLRDKFHLLKHFYAALETHFLLFQSNPENTIKQASLQLGCSKSLLKKYYQDLVYRLHEPHFMGLERFRLEQLREQACQK